MTNKKSLATKMYEFMQSVPFGDQIAMDYYGDINEAYDTDYKRVRRAQQEVSVLLEELSPVTDEELLEALPHAFSGRLEYRFGVFDTDSRFEYTAGQFYNIEVPQAVQAVLEEVKRNRSAKCSHEDGISYRELIQVDGLPYYTAVCESCGKYGTVELLEGDNKFDMSKSEVEKFEDEAVK